MTISKLESEELFALLERLSGVVGFDKDLPMNVFVGGGYLFWFFERPLLCFFEVFKGLVLQTASRFHSNLFIKFSGGKPLENSCFSSGGDGLERDISWLSKSFENFFEGAVGYPVALCDSACNWVAFESAYEEFGVVAVKKSGLKNGFCEYMDSNFISMDEFVKLASGFSVESKIARALVSSYCS